MRVLLYWHTYGSSLENCVSNAMSLQQTHGSLPMISNPMIAKLHTGDLVCRYGIIHGHGPKDDGRLSLIDTYPTWEAAHAALVAVLESEVKQMKQDMARAVANLWTVSLMERPND